MGTDEAGFSEVAANSARARASVPAAPVAVPNTQASEEANSAGRPGEPSSESVRKGRDAALVRVQEPFVAIQIKLEVQKERIRRERAGSTITSQT